MPVSDFIDADWSDIDEFVQLFCAQKGEAVTGEWTYAIARPAGQHRLCWMEVPQGRYAIDANTPAPGSWRVWFEPHGRPTVCLGDASSLRDALALAERDRSWGLTR